MQLETYITEHRTQILELVFHFANELSNEEDTPNMRRGLVVGVYKALRMALGHMFAAGEEPGHYYGFDIGVCVCVLRPEVGKDLFGGYAVSCGLLLLSGMIPCPEGSLSTEMALPPFIRELLRTAWRPPVESKLVRATPTGRVSLGEGSAGRRYVVDSLPGGEMWWRPIQPY